MKTLTLNDLCERLEVLFKKDVLNELAPFLINSINSEQEAIALNILPVWVAAFDKIYTCAEAATSIQPSDCNCVLNNLRFGVNNLRELVRSASKFGFSEKAKKFPLKEAALELPKKRVTEIEKKFLDIIKQCQNLSPN
ncbi:MAG: hypothetical protein FWF46_04635 [Oscillospiraceae bacterium]|nr:hypothetical protein [Oscillospiraceae bacterium]